MISSSKRSSNSRRELGRGQRDERLNHHLGRKRNSLLGLANYLVIVGNKSPAPEFANQVLQSRPLYGGRLHKVRRTPQRLSRRWGPLRGWGRRTGRRRTNEIKRNVRKRWRRRRVRRRRAKGLRKQHRRRNGRRGRRRRRRRRRRRKRRRRRRRRTRRRLMRRRKTRRLRTPLALRPRNPSSAKKVKT